MANHSRGLLVALVVLMLPAAALAQSSIAGAVKDASGAVLPGVTVEASSAALIEKTRTRRHRRRRPIQDRRLATRHL